MGKTQQAAGGGLTGADKAKLTPSNIRQGVTLFEGTGRQMSGTLRMLQLEIGGAGSYDIKALLPDHWAQLTSDNFLFKSISVRGAINNQSGDGWLSWSGTSATASCSYNPGTGMLTVTLQGSTAGIDYKKAGVNYTTTISGTCVCWYLS